MQDCHKNTHTNGEEHHGFGLTEVVLLSSDGFAAPDGDGFLRRKEEEKREVSAFAMDIIESRGHTHTPTTYRPLFAFGRGTVALDNFVMDVKQTGETY
jgi:hypothetical protein